MIVSDDDLQMSIERRLEDLSEQAERLRCALDALGPAAPAPARSATGMTPRSTGPRGRRAAAPGATQHLVASEAAALSADRNDTPQLTANDQPASAAEGQSTAPAVGADRALHELRSELTAALRNGRS